MPRNLHSILLHAHKHSPHTEKRFLNIGDLSNPTKPPHKSPTLRKAAHVLTKAEKPNKHKNDGNEKRKRKGKIGKGHFSYTRKPNNNKNNCVFFQPVKWC